MAEYVVVYKETLLFRQIVEADSEQEAIEFAKDNSLPRGSEETSELSNFHIEGKE